MNASARSRALAVTAAVAWFLMLIPHPYTVILAGSIACLTLPLFRWLRARMGRTAALAAYISILALIILIPCAIVTILVAPQAFTGIYTLSDFINNGFVLPPFIQEQGHKLYNLLLNIPGFAEWYKDISDYVSSQASSAIRAVLSGGLHFAGGTLSIVLQTMLMVVLASLGVMYAPTLYRLTLRITGLPEDSADRMIIAARTALRAVFIGILFVACIQGFLTGIGLSLFGVSEAAFWGMLAAFSAVIPIVGTALVWVPMAIVLWVQGSPMYGLGLIAWGCVVVSGADSLMRPCLLKRGIETSVLVLFLSIICAVSAFGGIGLIIGPVLVALAIQAMHESDALALRGGQEPAPTAGESEKISDKTPEKDRETGA